MAQVLTPGIDNRAGMRGSVEAGSSLGLTNAHDLADFAAKLQSEGMGASAIMKTLDRSNSAKM